MISIVLVRKAEDSVYKFQRTGMLDMSTHVQLGSRFPHLAQQYVPTERAFLRTMRRQLEKDVWSM